MQTAGWQLQMRYCAFAPSGFCIVAAASVAAMAPTQSHGNLVVNKTAAVRALGWALSDPGCDPGGSSNHRLAFLS